MQWTANGTAICTYTGDQEDPQICEDGSGGVIIVWQDRRSGSNIYAQRINATGSVQWASNGTAICTNTGGEDPQLCADGSGGAIITWYDWRSGGYDIYAQRVVQFPTSNHPKDIATTISGSEAIYWKLCADVEPGEYRVWVNDTNNNYYIWMDWASWTNNTYFIIPINRSATGVFNFTIEYYNIFGLQGNPDSVFVTVCSSAQEPGQSDLPLLLAVTQGKADFSSLLLSPIFLGIVAGIVVLFTTLISILVRNNKMIKELSEKINKLDASTKNSKKLIEK